MSGDGDGVTGVGSDGADDSIVAISSMAAHNAWTSKAFVHRRVFSGVGDSPIGAARAASPRITSLLVFVA